MAREIITVAFFRNANGNIYGFEVSNHTKDIVCAAVSILTLNTINSIECFLEDVDITYDVDVVKMGYISFRFLDEMVSETNEKARLLMDAYALGIHSLKEDYPKNIRIIE